jgi:hypothetical protein
LPDRGQFAVEHMLVVAFGILIMIPIIYFFYSYSVNQMDEVTMTQLNRMGNDIINNAESVYYMGNPSRITLDSNMPAGVRNITIVGNKELVFKVTYKDKLSDVAFSSNVPIVGPYLNETNTNCNSVCYSAGLKHITVISQGENVSIVFR